MVDGIEVERRAPFGDNPVVGERGARTQRRILTAALRVFAEHGYHDSRIEQITEAAGCSRPTFYQYFSSKEDVFRALAGHVGRSMVEMTARLGPVTADEAGRAALVRWLEEFADFYETHAPVFTAFSAAVRTDADLGGRSAAVSSAFGRALRRNLDTGTANSVDPDVMASVVVTMIVRSSLLRNGRGDLISRRRFVESLAALVHRVLLGPRQGVNDADAPAPRAKRQLRREKPIVLDAEPDRILSPQGRRMRERLVGASAVVFPRRGYHETRVDDVVEEAGASHGSFYRYFENKEDLFRVVATDAAGHMISRIDSFPDDGDPDALRIWLVDWFGAYAEHGAIIAQWREMESSDPAVGEITRRVADSALGALMEVLDEHGTGDPLVNAMAFLALIETVPHHVHGLGYFDQNAAVEAMVGIIRRGFLGLELV